MVRRTQTRTKSRRLAMASLLIFGAFVVILGLLVLGVGLVVTHNDTFHDTTGLKEKIESTIDYVQYWIGLPYVLTGISVACSAVNLRRVPLTVCTILLSILCVVLSLAGLVVDGPDFVMWKNYRAKEKYWEGQESFACTSQGDTCKCEGNSATSPETISGFTDCGTLMTLSSLYGLLIGSFIVGLVILLASTFIIVYIVSSKRERARREGEDYKTTNHVVEVEKPETVFQNPSSVRTVKEEPRRQPQFNPLYEYPAPPPPPIEPPKPMPHKEAKSAVSESPSRSNLDDASIANNGGVVMMDPGRFRLGDDDIY